MSNNRADAERAKIEEIMQWGLRQAGLKQLTPTRLADVLIDALDRLDCCGLVPDPMKRLYRIDNSQLINRMRERMGR
jgi:hypothetical protein